MSQNEDPRNVQFRKALEQMLNNLAYADDEDVARGYLRLKEAAQMRAQNETEWEREVQRELNTGDLMTRRRMAEDMIVDGMEFSAGPDEPWYYGSLTIHRHSNENGAYLTLRDFDGGHQGILQIQKFADQEIPAEALQEELDRREQEVYKQL